MLMALVCSDVFGHRWRFLEEFVREAVTLDGPDAPAWATWLP